MSAWGVLKSRWDDPTVVEIVGADVDTFGPYFSCRYMGRTSTFKARDAEIERFDQRARAEKRLAELYCEED